MESKDRCAERRQHIQKRLKVFNELVIDKKLDGLMLSFDYAKQLIRFMDMGLIYYFKKIYKCQILNFLVQVHYMNL
jgi:hypothetical protein